MSGTSSKPAVTPASLFSIVSGIVVAVAALMTLSALSERDRYFMENGVSPDTFVHVYRFLSMSHHFPDFLEPVKKYRDVYWVLSYAWCFIGIGVIMGLILGRIFARVFEKPAVSLLDDPHYHASHTGVDTPELNYLETILPVIPDADSLLMLKRDLMIGAIDPVAPASVSSNIQDKPGGEI